MKHALLAAFFVATISTQMSSANEDWQRKNARLLIEAACEAQTYANKDVLGSTEVALSCSIETPTAYATQSFDLADSLARTSGQLLRYRIMNKQRLSMDSIIQIEHLEIIIDSLVAKFRARGTATILFE